MPLAQRVSEYVRACFTGLWIESHEHEDALTEIARLCHEQEWRLATWDIDAGLQVQGADSTLPAGQDPLAAIRALPAMATNDGTAILVLSNFHRFLTSAEILQALARQIAAGKENRCFIVILSSVVSIPTELEKLFVVIEHELPGREQLADIAQGIANEPGELPDGPELDRILDAAAGLTRYEAEAAFSLSLVREGRVTAATLWEQKSQMLKKSGLLSLYRGGERFEHLGGLTALKAFCQRALRQDRDKSRQVQPRGILLLSPPGCGKAQLTQCPSRWGGL